VPLRLSARGRGPASIVSSRSAKQHQKTEPTTGESYSGGEPRKRQPHRKDQKCGDPPTHPEFTNGLAKLWIKKPKLWIKKQPALK
jgi:hypothetical protein